MPGSQANAQSEAILDLLHRGVHYTPQSACPHGPGVFVMHQEGYNNCE